MGFAVYKPSSPGSLRSIVSSSPYPGIPISRELSSLNLVVLEHTMSGLEQTQGRWVPLVLSLLAGLSTCLGAAIVFVIRRDPSNKQQALSHGHMSFSLALAGSVMVTVSFLSLLPESFSVDDTASFTLLSIKTRLFWQRVAEFVLGCAAYWMLSKCVFPEPASLLSVAGDESSVPLPPLTRISSRGQPELNGLRARASVMTPDYPVSSDADNDGTKSLVTWNTFSAGTDLTSQEARRAWRLALLMFVSLAVHNFPEGFAVAASSIHSVKLGTTTAVAIAFHNIPEGIAIAVPCLAARPDKPWLAFCMASLSGMAEPLGAAVAMVFLQGVDRSSSNSLLSTKDVLSFVAGVMVMVAINELFPEASRHTNDGHLPLVAGLVVGALIMIASDAVLEAA